MSHDLTDMEAKLDIISEETLSLVIILNLS